MKPAEFVVFRIAQYSGGATVSEWKGAWNADRRRRPCRFHFGLEIDGVTIGKFKEVSGVNAEITTMEPFETERPAVLKKLPGRGSTATSC